MPLILCRFFQKLTPRLKMILLMTAFWTQGTLKQYLVKDFRSEVFFCISERIWRVLVKHPSWFLCLPILIAKTERWVFTKSNSENFDTFFLTHAYSHHRRTNFFVERKVFTTDWNIHFFSVSSELLCRNRRRSAGKRLHGKHAILSKNVSIS